MLHNSKQNRVTPYGHIIATPERGLYMGNRGILHNEQKEIVTPFVSKAWIICRLEFNGRRRQLMSPGRYTELFFLDEATALAAGHRPCWECQRKRSTAFRTAWLKAHGHADTERPLRMSEIDAVLHRERLTTARLKKNQNKKTYTAVLGSLPDGTFVEIDKRPCLLWNNSIHFWTPGGYQKLSSPLLKDKLVAVLTPPSTVEVFQQGYTPVTHPTVQI